MKITSTQPGAKITIYDTTILTHSTSDTTWDEVSVSSRSSGVTPTTAILKRGEHHTIALRKDGFKTALYTTGNSVEPWFWGNWFCLPYGTIIDLGSEAAYRVTPVKIDATLVPGTPDYEIERVFPDSTSSVWIAPLASYLILSIVLTLLLSAAVGGSN